MIAEMWGEVKGGGVGFVSAVWLFVACGGGNKNRLTNFVNSMVWRTISSIFL